MLTVCWSVIFFFASAAASSAYLTVSESFPLEARALAIAFFYAVGTGIGGVASPWLFGVLVGSGERGAVLLGYLFGAALTLGPALQARGYDLNQFALDVLPYLLTLIALVFLGRKRVEHAPEGLKSVFELAPSS